MIFVVLTVLISIFVLLILGGINTMATLADLDAAIATLTTQQTQLATDVSTLITDVEALIAKLNAGQDFTNEVTAVNADIAGLQATDTATTGEDTKVKAGQ